MSEANYSRVADEKPASAAAGFKGSQGVNGKFDGIGASPTFAVGDGGWQSTNCSFSTSSIPVEGSSSALAAQSGGGRGSRGGKRRGSRTAMDEVACTKLPSGAGRVCAMFGVPQIFLRVVGYCHRSLADLCTLTLVCKTLEDKVRFYPVGALNLPPLFKYRYAASDEDTTPWKAIVTRSQLARYRRTTYRMTQLREESRLQQSGGNLRKVAATTTDAALEVKRTIQYNPNESLVELLRNRRRRKDIFIMGVADVGKRTILQRIMEHPQKFLGLMPQLQAGESGSSMPSFADLVSSKDEEDGKVPVVMRSTVSAVRSGDDVVGCYFDQTLDAMLLVDSFFGWKGFTISCIDVEEDNTREIDDNINLDVAETSSSSEQWIRSRLKVNINAAAAIIYVVDGSKPGLRDAREVLRRIGANTPFLLLVNKLDLPTVNDQVIPTVEEKMKLPARPELIWRRRWCIQGCSVEGRSGAKGLVEGMRWLCTELRNVQN